VSGLHVVVDGANLRGAVQRLGDSRLDARQFRAWAHAFDDRGIGTTIQWFQANYPGMGAFYSHLRAAGIRVVTREPKRLPDGSRKANMDVEIAMAATVAAATADTILLVSGDGDFIPLVSDLARRGLRVIVMSGERELDRHYREVLPATDLLLLEDELRWFAHDLAS
jgi:hypothetical protein